MGKKTESPRAQHQGGFHQQKTTSFSKKNTGTVAPGVRSMKISMLRCKALMISSPPTWDKGFGSEI